MNYILTVISFFYCHSTFQQIQKPFNDLVNQFFYHNDNADWNKAVDFITADEEPDLEEVNLSILKTTKAVAFRLEILDEREVNLLSSPINFEGDLHILRQRYSLLKKICPPASDILRFPNREVVVEMLQFNCQYRTFLEGQQRCFGNDSWYYEAIQETNKLYVIWDLVSDAENGNYRIVETRIKLQEIREKIGYDNYMNGAMPPNVPVWRFRRIY